MAIDGSGKRENFDLNDLMANVTEATKAVNEKLKIMKQNTDSVSVGDMFEMQMLMNHLTQLSEMSTSVVSASNTAIASLARNVKS